MTLIIHPEVKKLKEELSQLILEYDELTNHICPDIERRYVLKFGLYEYRLYERELQIDKLKRKIQLIRIEINHGNDLDLDKINRKLDAEFEEYEKQVQAQIDEIKYLEENNPEKLSPDDSKKLKKLYRKLIKRLHPDLHPNQTFFELNLFYRAVYCFEKGDLKGLESVATLLPEDDVEEVSEIEKIKDLIREFEERISKLKDDYPYNKNELLDDRNASNEYISMLLDLIKDREEDIRNLEKRINKLIENV